MTLTDWPAAIKRQSTARKAGIALAVVIVVALLVLGGLYAFVSMLYYDSYESNYNYELRISVDRATEDAVFIAPVPEHDGTAALGDLTLWTYEDRVGDWEYDILETEHGPMLRIAVAEITGSDELEFTATTEADRTIETKNPRGVEPVLSPMYDLVETNVSQESRPDYRRFDVTSMMYAEHGGDDDVELSFVVRYEGANTWWTLGWSGNYYETYVSAFDVTPDAGGDWRELQGDHREGFGSYARYAPPPPH